nr:protein kinase-like domain, concanavalin A-like lectin/glucanase domain protein [Tanacetum cinerariifolium]
MCVVTKGDSFLPVNYVTDGSVCNVYDIIRRVVLVSPTCLFLNLYCKHNGCDIMEMIQDQLAPKDQSVKPPFKCNAADYAHITHENLEYLKDIVDFEAEDLSMKKITLKMTLLIPSLKPRKKFVIPYLILQLHGSMQTSCWGLVEHYNKLWEYKKAVLESNPERGDGVACIKRRRHDLSGDGVWILLITLQRSRLKNSNPSSSTSNSEFLDPKKKIEIESWLEDSRTVDSSVGSDEIEYFDTFPTLEELEYHEWLLKYPKPSWVKAKIRTGNLNNIKISCMIGHFLKRQAYIDLESPIDVMSKQHYKGIMNKGLESRQKPSNPSKNNKFVGRVRGLKVFVGNFTYECNFMILEDTTSIIDHHLGEVVFGKPFARKIGLVCDQEEGTVTFKKDNKKITFKMPHKMEAFNHIDFKDVNTDSIPPFVHENKDDVGIPITRIV